MIHSGVDSTSVGMASALVGRSLQSQAKPARIRRRRRKLDARLHVRLRMLEMLPAGLQHRRQIFKIAADKQILARHCQRQSTT